VALAEERLGDLKAQLEDMRVQRDKQLEDMRQQRDRWQSQAERLAALPAPPTTPPPLTRWRWLRSTG
jgi:hypothetical protein